MFELKFFAIFPIFGKKKYNWETCRVGSLSKFNLDLVYDQQREFKALIGWIACETKTLTLGFLQLEQDCLEVAFLADSCPAFSLYSSLFVSSVAYFRANTCFLHQAHCHLSSTFFSFSCALVRFLVDLHKIRLINAVYWTNLPRECCQMLQVL